MKLHGIRPVLWVVFATKVFLIEGNKGSSKCSIVESPHEIAWHQTGPVGGWLCLTRQSKCAAGLSGAITLPLLELLLWSSEILTGWRLSSETVERPLSAICGKEVGPSSLQSGGMICGQRGAGAGNDQFVSFLLGVLVSCCWEFATRKKCFLRIGLVTFGLREITLRAT